MHIAQVFFSLANNNVFLLKKSNLDRITKVFYQILVPATTGKICSNLIFNFNYIKLNHD